MQERFAMILLWLGFSIQSLASQDHQEIPKYFLKSGAGPDDGIYYPLKISLEVDESSFQNTQSDKAVKEAAATTASIFLDLVLSQPSKEAIKLGEKIQCDDFLIRQIVKSQGINADFAWHITYSNKSEKEIVTIKKCENGSQLLAVSIAINLEKFLKLETVSQVKFLSLTLASTIFEDGLIRNQLLSEIEDYLQHLTENLSDVCIANCFSCVDSTTCSVCNEYYYLNANDTQCCGFPHCETCNKGNYCDSCVEGSYFSNGNCLPCVWENCINCNATNCLGCQPGYFVFNGVFCFACSTGCELCKSTGIGVGSVCTQCYDPDHSILTNGECICTNPNFVFDQNNVCACPPGFYEGPNENCLACNFGCETCTSPDQCTFCFDSNSMIPHVDGSCSCANAVLKFNTTTHTCSCPYREYFNSQSNTCELCPDACASCYSSTDCIDCVNNNILIPGGDNCYCIDSTKVYDNTTETCVPCPDGKYANNGVCAPCVNGCATCTTSTECTSCLPGMHLYQNTYACLCNEAFDIFDSGTNSCISCNPSQNVCTSNCFLGCKACTEYPACQTCFDDEKMFNEVCICKDHEKVFNPAKQKCVNVSSAKGLTLIWILVLYAAI
ncbi:unnamed protein product [Blepharisma stoltei]|uniref:Uncharacterized protein n=1 Tax=Blepharisma stoltei TaxID=1481888 RepID=A0AAU9IB16_9CILI|nr:unnamed protein product [Blepharisma stoltei]